MKECILLKITYLRETICEPWNNEALKRIEKIKNFIIKISERGDIGKFSASKGGGTPPASVGGDGAIQTGSTGTPSKMPYYYQ